MAQTEAELTISDIHTIQVLLKCLSKLEQLLCTALLSCSSCFKKLSKSRCLSFSW